ncbi:HEAT repeat domain-containing protein [Idiomarina piscisalsi]|uniref:HEAT repeat domain-containing protein n=1 Tax=Idiomarina piscisalsi TaxID=1096243 RepID=UPI0018E07E7E|nr:hypothetical protein [Idiomarina piscisalsi]
MIAGGCCLDFAIDSEQLLQWMHSALLVIVVFVLLVWSWLFILRIIHQEDEKKRNELQRQWRRFLFECCANPKAELPERAQIKQLWQDTQAFLWFIQLWSLMHRYVRGDADDGLERLAEHIRLERQALELMRGQDVRTLIATAIAMGDLQKLSPATIKRLKELTQHSSSMVVLTALRALMRNDQTIAVPILLQLKRFVAPERLVTIAKECDSRYLIQQAQKILLETTAEHAVYLLTVLQGVNAPLSSSEAETLIRHFKSQPEATAQLIPLLDHPHHLPLIRRLTQSAELSIRVQATRMLGELARNKQDLERLWQLLQDSAWWVRYRAARGIFSHPEFSPDYLKEQLTELADPFARNMLMQVANEMNLEIIDA